MKKTVKLISLLLCVSLMLTLSGCALDKEQVMALLAPTHEEEGQVETVTPTEQPVEEQENIERYKELSGQFNPLFAEADGDLAVVEATQLTLAQLPEGAIRTSENEDGSYTVTVELPGGLRYSDGEAMDIDDLLFTLYALLDESYTGPSELKALPIVGLQDYYHGVNHSLWEKYSALFDELYNEGRYDEDLQKTLKEKQLAQPYNDYHERVAQKALDAYDQQKADEIRQTFMDAWREDAEKLVDYCLEKFAATAEYHTGYTVEELRQNRGLQIMFAMVELSFGNLLDNGTLVGKKTGTSWDMTESFPTVDDFYNEMVESYGGSAETYWAIEGIGRGDIVELARKKAVLLWAEQDADWDGGEKRISGIVRVGDRMATITFESLSGEYLKALTELSIVPRHFFAVETYDYAEGAYGFPKGNTAALSALSGSTMGAGEYTLEAFEDGQALLKSRNSDETRILATAAG